MEVSSRISNLSMLEKENNELKIKLQNLTNSFNKEVRNGLIIITLENMPEKMG